jgi:hypothetical protein
MYCTVLCAAPRNHARIVRGGGVKVCHYPAATLTFADAFICTNSKIARTRPEIFEVRARREYSIFDV